MKLALVFVGVAALVGAFTVGHAVGARSHDALLEVASANNRLAASYERLGDELARLSPKED